MDKNNKGHVFLAQNSDVDYVRQAYALASTIKQVNKIYNKTCLITNEIVPEEYKSAFDYIIPIPWGDLAKNSDWKVENRWKIIYATPFDENIVYDTDMLLLSSNDSWWNFFEDRDLVFTSNVLDYRGNVIKNDFYRKTIVENHLPNIYVGCFYFKKTEMSFKYFEMLDTITHNWQDCYNKLLKNKTQKFYSMDVSTALALMILDIKFDTVIPNGQYPKFTHMKPAIQNWQQVPARWTDVLNVEFGNNLIIGGYAQHGLFHYVEDEFLTDNILKKIKYDS
jgi:hypothetical protein